MRSARSSANSTICSGAPSGRKGRATPIPGGGNSDQLAVLAATGQVSMRTPRTLCTTVTVTAIAIPSVCSDSASRHSADGPHVRAQGHEVEPSAFSLPISERRGNRRAAASPY
jgi:hypothetical protein